MYLRIEEIKYDKVFTVTEPICLKEEFDTIRDDQCSSSMFIIVDLVNIVNLVDTNHYRVKCQNLQNSVHTFDGFIDSNIDCNKKNIVRVVPNFLI